MKFARLKVFEFGEHKGIQHLLRQIQLISFLFSNRRGVSLIYLWFADYHGFFPTLFAWLFRINLVTAVGGFDAAKMPEYQYGAHRSGLRSNIIRFVLLNSNLSLFSSQFTAQSLWSIFPDLKLKLRYKVVYPGIKVSRDIPVSTPQNTIQRQFTLVYVASGSSWNRMLIKGVDRFLEVSQIMPDHSFLLIGPSGAAFDRIKSMIPNNCTLLSEVPINQLPQYYENAKFVALFSRFEAFGMVLLEGIASAAIPLTIEGLGSAEILQFDGCQGKVFREFDAPQIASYLTQHEHDCWISNPLEYLNNFPPDARANCIQRSFFS